MGTFIKIAPNVLSKMGGGTNFLEIESLDLHLVYKLNQTDSIHSGVLISLTLLHPIGKSCGNRGYTCTCICHKPSMPTKS